MFSSDEPPEVEQFKKLCAPPFTAALFTLAKFEQPRRSSLHERIKKGVCVCSAHSALGCHSAIRETDPAICNNMDGPGGCYAK